MPVLNQEVDSSFRLSASPIHGLGMFASRPIKAGEIFPCCGGGVRYNTARYVNHSDEPNAVMDVIGNAGWMRVLLDLQVGDEVTMDYEDNRAKSIAASLAQGVVRTR